MGGMLSNVVFQPPPCEYHLKDGREYVELKTSLNERIFGVHIDAGHELTVLFSHGNAEELGSVSDYLEQVFCPTIKVNAFAYEYTGYGRSSGTPTEEALYADVECALDYVIRHLHVDPRKLVLYGRSLGSGPTVHLGSNFSQRYPFRAIVLQSPITSCFRIAVKTETMTLPGDLFVNIDKIDRVRCPVMVIHGSKDTVVPFWHGRELFARCRVGLDFLWLPEAGHNDIESGFGDKMFPRLRAFIHETSAKFALDQAMMQADLNTQKKSFAIGI